MSKVKMKIQIGGKEIEITVEDARELKMELEAILNPPPKTTERVWGYHQLPYRYQEGPTCQFDDGPPNQWGDK